MISQDMATDLVNEKVDSIMLRGIDCGVALTE
jgi:hypothetical protein